MHTSFVRCLVFYDEGQAWRSAWRGLSPWSTNVWETFTLVALIFLPNVAVQLGLPPFTDLFGGILPLTQNALDCSDARNEWQLLSDATIHKKFDHYLTDCNHKFKDTWIFIVRTLIAEANSGLFLPIISPKWPRVAEVVLKLGSISQLTGKDEKVYDVRLRLTYTAQVNYTGQFFSFSPVLTLIMNITSHHRPSRSQKRGDR